MLCTDPAAPAGGTGELEPYFPTRALPGGSRSAAGGTPADVTTPWVSYPGLYRATCMTGGGATWLQVTDAAAPGDRRPVVGPVLGPRWGLHLVDVNLALGNLVALVGDQSRAHTG